ncbi:translation elongation factor Ts [Acanthopleuribacter pedis]|uniref:Elongation factor Ts n=1 Tax=Acanthopleuribacter pedis TaxID=442870 RepID=A0A8J7QDK0_9BACT|nr:translation elongation factor Ts [Acanthopleuribacter pedis]MBO1322179.1 translation elongation factor Ts [Acanthopleuribacter pedis]
MSISAKDVKELRERTGLGMMECKKALVECNGNLDEAVTYLRKRSEKKVEKLSTRIAAEGTVHSYVHGNGRIGVLLELNCETDFTARNDNFQALAKDIALHIAAAAPSFLSRDEVQQADLEKEKEIAREKAIAEGKPEKVVDRIVTGKMEKYYEENVLLEQKFVKDPKKSVEDLIKETTHNIGEKITLRRFARYELGEGIEKREDNFAEEVAKQVAGN